MDGFPWEEIVAAAASYIVGWATASGRINRWRKVAEAVIRGVEKTGRTVVRTDPVKREISTMPEGDSMELKGALDKISPVRWDPTRGLNNTPRVSRRRKIVSALLDVIPVVGALRRTPR